MRLLITLPVAFMLTTIGCFHTLGDAPVVVVKTSYPKSNAQIVAETVAAPVEQHVYGVERLERTESESRSGGLYTLRASFQPGTDPNLAIVLIQNRLALAQPLLPEAVVRNGIEVKAETRQDKKRVVIALRCRGNHDRESLRRFSEALCKRLSAEKALVNPEMFPGSDMDQASVHINRKKCGERGVPFTNVMTAIQNADLNAKIESWETLRVDSSNGQKIPLNALADVKIVKGATGVYRLNLCPAVRIIGTPPEGKTAEAAASQCVELAEQENRDRSGRFAAVNLTAR